MKHTLFYASVLTLAAALPSSAAPVLFSASGTAPSDIQATVDAFRLSLGTLNPNVAGSFASGRREVNWDGVPAGFSSPNAFPGNFFNSNSPRGIVSSTPGTSLQVSGTAGVAPVRFDNINPTYSSTFLTFSAQKLFTAVDSTVNDATFFVPGSSTVATTTAFGAIFTDVDLANTTSLQFFSLNNTSLGTFFVPVANNGLSFVGVSFNAGEQIGRVRITSGNTALGPNDAPGVDVVAMDDFIYAEPQAAASGVPEPSTYLLLGGGLSVLALLRRRKR